METLRKNYKLIKCNLCGADDYSVIYGARYELEGNKDISTKFRSSGDEILIDRIVRCNRCGLIYINPVLEPSIILEGYKKGKDEVFVSQNYAREKTFERCLGLIEKYYPSNGRILDIGTAGGAFLYICRQRGWDVAGCEPNEWLCQWAKDNYKIDVYRGTIFDLPYREHSFDVITLWDVLEHTSDPKNVLETCNKLLKPGGLIVINFPDIGSWIAKFMGWKWVFLLSVHLYYFDKETILRMLKDRGFDPVCIKPHFQYLELSYIITRSRPYIGPIANMARRLIEVLRIDNSLIPYWIGQTLIIARKTKINKE